MDSIKKKLASSGSSSGGSLKLHFPSGSTSSSSSSNILKSINKDDPMLNFLCKSLFELEETLISINAKTTAFLIDSEALCGSMVTLASSINNYCKNDEALMQDTMNYENLVRSILSEEQQTQEDDDSSPFNEMKSTIELKILKPIQVNLNIIQDIKKRMHQREQLRRKISKNGGGISSPQSIRRQNSGKQRLQENGELFNQLTKDLFEELSTMHQYRYDFVRTPYQCLKQCQGAFFSNMGQALNPLSSTVVPRPASSAEPTKAPPPLKSLSAMESLQSMKERGITIPEKSGNPSMSSKSMNLFSPISSIKKKNNNNQERTKQKEDDIIIAQPTKGTFNPTMDAPAAGTIYSTLGRAKGEDSKAATIEKIDEQTATMPKISSGIDSKPFTVKIKSKPSTTNNQTEKKSSLTKKKKKKKTSSKMKMTIDLNKYTSSEDDGGVIEQKGEQGMVQNSASSSNVVMEEENFIDEDFLFEERIEDNFNLEQANDDNVKDNQSLNGEINYVETVSNELQHSSLQDGEEEYSDDDSDEFSGSDYGTM